jgi:hypothetical protein
MIVWFAVSPRCSCRFGYPKLKGSPEDVGDVVLGDRQRAGGEQPLLLHGPVDQVRDVGLAKADGADAVGDVDVAHERRQHPGQERRQVRRPVGAGRQQLGRPDVALGGGLRR